MCGGRLVRTAKHRYSELHRSRRPSRGSGVPPATRSLLWGAVPPVNWRAIVSGPSGTFLSLRSHFQRIHPRRTPLIHELFSIVPPRQVLPGVSRNRPHSRRSRVRPRSCIYCSWRLLSTIGPGGIADNSSAFPTPGTCPKTEPRPVGTPDPAVQLYPQTYRGSYSTLCFFKNAMNSSSKLRLRWCSACDSI